MGDSNDTKGTPRGFNGLNPDFDIEAHRGEAIYIGKNFADARFTGYVRDSLREPTDEDTEAGSTRSDRTGTADE